MKKVFSTMAIFAAFIPDAHAEPSFIFKPYVGFDLQRSVYDYNNNYDIGGGFSLDGDTLLEDSLNGANIHIGARLHKNLGLELGYFRTQEEGKSIATGTVVGKGLVAATDFDTDIKLNGFTLDALGYIPLTEKLELIGTGGVSWTKGEVTLTIPTVGNESVNESEIGFRIGGGAQFNFTDNINARALVRYQTADFDDVADNAWTGTVGLNYSF